MSRVGNVYPASNRGTLVNDNSSNETRRLRMHDSRVESWIDTEVIPGIEVRGAALRDWSRANLATYHHPIGTCRLGPIADPLAVVDTKGRVHGFDNLYVADASIMPTIPRQINLTVYAIGEKIGDALAGA